MLERDYNPFNLPRLIILAVIFTGFALVHLFANHPQDPHSVVDQKVKAETCIRKEALMEALMPHYDDILRTQLGFLHLGKVTYLSDLIETGEVEQYRLKYCPKVLPLLSAEDQEILRQKLLVKAQAVSQKQSEDQKAIRKTNLIILLVILSICLITLIPKLGLAGSLVIFPIQCLASIFVVFFALATMATVSEVGSRLLSGNRGDR